MTRVLSLLLKGKEIHIHVCGAHSIISLYDVVDNYLVHEVIQTMVLSYTSKCDISVRIYCE